MESKKINQLATSVSPQTSDLTIIGDPVTGVSKKITLLQIANLFATTGTVSSVAVTETGDALTITGSPITSTGTINIGFAGAANQYVRGDGALSDFPTSSGGGSSVSYYLNSSVSQGTIGGVAYKELSKEPVIGAGTDITISANGYVASYITDANDPDLLSVPGGNFNCEFYFSVNSDAHNPSFYAELYKYDGTTFTLLGSSQAVPEYLSNGTTISPYYFAIPVATAALNLTDRIAIRIYVDVDTRIVTLHTENNHLCQVVTTFSKGMVSLNNLTDQSQFITTGTSGTNFNIVSTGDTHTFNLPVASATNTGKLSNTDWSTFNNKLSTATAAATYVPYTGATTNVDLGNNDFTALGISGIAIEAKLNGTGSSPLILRTGTSGYSYGNDSISLISSPTTANTLIITSDVSSVTKIAQIGLGSLTATRTFTLPDASGTLALTSQLTGGTVTSVGLSSATSGVTIGSSPITTSGTITLSIATASGSQNGLLSSTDWTTFNNKQAALTNPITGTGTRTINYLPIFSGSDTTIANSAITDNGTTVTLISRALSGTSATFSGSGGFGSAPMSSARLTITDATSIAAYWKATNTNTATRDWTIITNNANFGDFAIRQGNSQGADATVGTDRLLISSTGAATFSDSVTNKVTNISADGAGVVLQGYVDNSLRIAVRGSGYNSGARGGLLASTGDFSSSVTATAATFSDIVTNTTGGYRTLASQGYVLRNDANSASLGGLVRRSNWAGTAALDTQIFAETGYGIFLNVNGSTTTGINILSSGNVGIGTTSTDGKLHVNAGTGQNFVVAGDGTNICSINNYSSASGFRELKIVGSPLTFYTGNAGEGSVTERMRITSQGQTQFIHSQTDLDIIYARNGSASPYGMNITYTAASPNNGSNNFLYLADSTTLRFAARSNGGLSNFSGNNVNLASDRRLKKDIISLSNQWDKLKQIEVVNYKYKDSTDETALYGAIAQQVQEVYPELVIVTREATETEPEYYGLREQPFQWLTTKVLQEAMAKIETLETELTELKALINK